MLKRLIHKLLYLKELIRHRVFHVRYMEIQVITTPDTIQVINFCSKCMKIVKTNMYKGDGVNE